MSPEPPLSVGSAFDMLIGGGGGASSGRSSSGFSRSFSAICSSRLRRTKSITLPCDASSGRLSPIAMSACITKKRPNVTRAPRAAVPR